MRLIHRLALQGDGRSGPIGAKAIVTHPNGKGIFTRDGGRRSIWQVHRILTRRTYIGEHRFRKCSKTGKANPPEEDVTVPVPPLLERETFDALEKSPKARNPKVAQPHVVTGPILLTGLRFCDRCGGVMTPRIGKSKRYRCYTCSIRVRQGDTGCKGRTTPMDGFDGLVVRHPEERLLAPDRLEEIPADVLARRQARAVRAHTHVAKLNRRAGD